MRQNVGHVGLESQPAKAQLSEYVVHLYRVQQKNNSDGDYYYRLQATDRPAAAPVKLPTYLLLLDASLLLYPRQYLGHVGFEHHPAHDQLGQDEMDLVHTR